MGGLQAPLQHNIDKTFSQWQTVRAEREMWGQHSLLCRDEEDLMFQMEATEDEEVTRRPVSCHATHCLCCEEPDQGPGE